MFQSRHWGRPVEGRALHAPCLEASIAHAYTRQYMYVCAKYIRLACHFSYIYMVCTKTWKCVSHDVKCQQWQLLYLRMNVQLLSIRTQYTCPLSFSCRELEAAAYGVGGATGSDPLLADDVDIFTSCVQTFRKDSKVLYTIIQHKSAWEWAVWVIACNSVIFKTDRNLPPFTAIYRHLPPLLKIVNLWELTRSVSPPSLWFNFS